MSDEYKLIINDGWDTTDTNLIGNINADSPPPMVFLKKLEILMREYRIQHINVGWHMNFEEIKHGKIPL